MHGHSHLSIFFHMWRQFKIAAFIVLMLFILASPITFGVTLALVDHFTGSDHLGKFGGKPTVQVAPIPLATLPANPSKVQGRYADEQPRTCYECRHPEVNSPIVDLWTPKKEDRMVPQARPAPRPVQRAPEPNVIYRRA